MHSHRIARLLSHKGKIRKNAPLIFTKLRAEPGCEQPVFGSHSNFRSENEQAERNQRPLPGSEDENRCKEHHQECGIDWMPHQRVGPGADKLMIVIQAGMNAKLFPQMLHGAKCQIDPHGCANQRSRQTGRRDWFRTRIVHPDRKGNGRGFAEKADPRGQRGGDALPLLPPWSAEQKWIKPNAPQHAQRDMADSGVHFSLSASSLPNTRSKMRSTLRSWRSSEKTFAICSRVNTRAISGSASIAARKSASSSQARIAWLWTRR